MIVPDMDEVTYHASEALSASGAKRLLPPGCPALFRWERDHGQPPKAAFDFGRAAHSVVLGAGGEIKVVDAADWRTKAAKADADEIRAAGHTPLLAHEWRQVLGMAEAIRAHPVASALLDPDHGKPEVSMFWHDDTHGVDRRARFDWLPDTDGGRLIVPDYKTASSADLHSIQSSVAKFGYAQQSEWYIDAATALGLAEDIAFVFIFQMKEPPYLITVVELDTQWSAIGRKRNDQAMQVYAECLATDTWPGFSDEVALIEPPRWALYEAGVA